VLIAAAWKPGSQMATIAEHIHYFTAYAVVLCPLPEMTLMKIHRLIGNI
jgi:hypothetical protein